MNKTLTDEQLAEIRKDSARPLDPQDIGDASAAVDYCASLLQYIDALREKHAAEVARLRDRHMLAVGNLLALHDRMCSPDNCVLDGVGCTGGKHHD